MHIRQETANKEQQAFTVNFTSSDWRRLGDSGRGLPEVVK